MSIPVRSSVKYQDKIRRPNAFTNISFFFPTFILSSVFPKVLFWQNTLTTSHNFHFQCLYPRTALEMSPSWYFSQIRSESSFWDRPKPYVLSRAARGNHHEGLNGPLNNDLLWSSGEKEWMNWKTYLQTHQPFLLSHFQIPTLNCQCTCYFPP